MTRAILLCLLAGCGANEKPKDPEPVPLTDLRKAYSEVIAEHQGRGWVVQDCDGMLWSAEAGVAAELGFDPKLAEIEPGKYWRRPVTQPCWTEAGGDQGAKTTWSRDMFQCGLLPWAVIKGRTDILSEHIAYGEAHGWLMGEPLADGRVLYSPILIGQLYRGARRDDPAARLPPMFVTGLVDYEAHLQACQALVEIEVKNEIPAKGREMIAEAAAREPGSPLYLYLDGLFTGSQAKTEALLTATRHPAPDYVRNDAQATAEWIFSAFLVLRNNGKLD